LGDFLKGVRNLGYAVKLDTNGHRPDALVALLDAGLVDYVAMDIKGPPAKYGRSAGMPDLDVTRIAASIARLAQGAVAHEFRTTVVPGLLDGDDIEAIARWVADLGGEDDRYILQQFRNAHTLDPSLRAAVPYPREVLEEMTERAGRRVTKVSLRGV
jgi:pyruvate formate lyase activating enzyme